MSKRIRIGVVGAGAFAKGMHLPALALQDSVELTAVANRSVDSARAAAEPFGIPFCTGDWRELVARDDVDAVLVTTLPEARAEVVRASLQAGKPTFSEAPLATDAATAKELAALAKTKGVLTGYAYPVPFLNGGPVLAEALGQGLIGVPRRASLTTHGHGWLHADPAQVWRARADTRPALLAGLCLGVLVELFGPLSHIDGRLERAFDEADAAPDALDALFECHSGLRGVVQAGWSPRPTPGHGVHVIGTRGALTWDWSTGAVSIAEQAGWRELDRGPAPGPAAWRPPVDFVEAALAGTQHPRDFERAAHEVELAERLALN